jgi:uncharacterized protein YceH (UPF0502 family)
VGADELRGHAGLGAAAASAGVTAFVAGMALGRIVGGRLALRLPADGLLLGAVGVAGAGFALFWSSTLPVLALGRVWWRPGSASRCSTPWASSWRSRPPGGRPDLATARVGFGVAIAVGLGPFALGALGDAFGTHRAFLLVPCLWWWPRRRARGATDGAGAAALTEQDIAVRTLVTMSDLPVLDAVEQRVIGCLLEKQVTVPATYPLTLNALRTACNQTSSRDPVLDLDERTVETTARALRDRGLLRIVWADTGRRVLKYHQTVVELLELAPDERAVVTVLLLRGPQTSGELKTRTERLYAFAGRDDVDVCLRRLADGRTRSSTARSAAPAAGPPLGTPARAGA